MSHVNLPIAARPPAAPQAQAQTAPAAAERPHLRAWQEKDGFSFADVIDIINPLQHIPLLNRAYRDITGDAIGAAAKIAGGTLFGGPIGLVASLADAAIEQSTGKDAGEHVAALFDGGEEEESATTAVAAASDEDEYARGTDVAEITGQGRTLDLELAEEDGGRWAVQVALADDAAWRQSQLAQNTHTPAAAPAPEKSPKSPDPAIAGPRAALRRVRHAAPEATPATPMHPLTSRAAPVGTRGLATHLPSPQALAANPELIAKARAPGGGDSEAWLRLMQAAGDAKGQGGAGLATATIAKAIASYGAAPGGLPTASAARAVKP